MPKLFTKVSIALYVLVITGCASKPREVTASVPLVSVSQEKPDKKEIPAQYWYVLSDAKQIKLVHEKYQIKLSELYTSALGVTCRELTITEKEQQMKRRIACEIPFLNTDNIQDKAWFLEKEIIESSSYVDL